MHVKILPVQSSFRFGLADTVSIRSISDNLLDRAEFFWQLGTVFEVETEIPATETEPASKAVSQSFVGDESAIGNVTLDGDAYANWSGANDELPALLLPKIGLSPA